jgi:zinc resistance-associated protein
MLKALLAGTTALTLVGGSAIYAQETQQTTPAQPGSTVTQPRMQITPEEYVARTNARITELKTELKLTPAQEKNWPVFETAVRESAKQRADHFLQVRKMRDQTGVGPQRGNRAEPTAEETVNQKHLAAALDPLYKSLDDGQKQRFATLFRMDGEGRQFWFRGRGERRDQRS